MVGIPHPELGEEVGAAVALKPGSEATAEELRAYVKEQRRRVQVPAARVARRPLPKGPTGKILKREVDVRRREVRS